MGWKLLEHMTDLFIEASNTSFEKTLEDLAEGMFAHMGGKDAKAVGSFNIEKKSGTTEGLVVELLSDILAECEIMGFTPVSLVVNEYKEGEIRATVKGEKKTLENIIKGVTYHKLEVKEEDGKWIMRVLFDI